MKVLIVGAGPTGLTAALECVRRGVPVEIVDAKPEPSPLSRAVGILPNSIEILRKNGVAERLIQESEKITHLQIERDGASLIDINVTKVLGDETFILSLPQDKTELILSERLATLGIHVRYDTKVTTVTTTKHDAVVTFADTATKTYDWVVGADGVRSTVRESLNIPFEGYELDEVWSIADVELIDGYDPTSFHAMLLKGPREERDAMVVVPITDNRVRLISSTPDSLATLPFNLNVKTIRRSGTFKISVRQAKKYATGRVILAGDAAHAHSPVGGRGMNLGIDDAVAVVTAILKNDTKTYEAERKHKASRVISMTESIRKSIVSNKPLTVLVFKAVAWLIQHIPYFQKKFIQRIMNLH